MLNNFSKWINAQINQNQDPMVLHLTWFMSQEEYKGEKVFDFMDELKRRDHCPFVWLVLFGKLLVSSGYKWSLREGLLRCRAQWMVDMVGEKELTFLFLTPHGQNLLILSIFSGFYWISGWDITQGTWQKVVLVLPLRNGWQLRRIECLS